MENDTVNFGEVKINQIPCLSDTVAGIELKDINTSDINNNKRAQ